MPALVIQHRFGPVCHDSGDSVARPCSIESANLNQENPRNAAPTIAALQVTNGMEWEPRHSRRVR